MGKLIINNQTESLNDHQCLTYVQKVISMGRVSNNKKQYCYATSFDSEVNGEIIVYTDLNKKSDKFTIIQRQN